MLSGTRRVPPDHHTLMDMRRLPPASRYDGREMDVTEQSGMDAGKQNTGQVPLTEEQLRAVHVNGLAPLSQPIHLADYDPAWPTLFACEPERVRSALASSTSPTLHLEQLEQCGWCAARI